MEANLQIGQYKLQKKMDSMNNQCLWIAWSDISQKQYLLLFIKMHPSSKIMPEQSKSEEKQTKFKHVLVPVHVFQCLLKDSRYLVQVMIYIEGKKIASIIKEINHKCQESEYMLSTIDYCIQMVQGYIQIVREKLIHEQLNMNYLMIRDNNVYITGYWLKPQPLGILPQTANSKNKLDSKKQKIKQNLAMKSLLLQMFLKQSKYQTAIFNSQAQLRNYYQFLLTKITNKDLLSLLQAVFEIIPEEQQTWSIFLSQLNQVRSNLLNKQNKQYLGLKQKDLYKSQNYVYLIPLLCIEYDQSLIDFNGWSTSCEINIGQDILQLLFGSEDDIEYLGFKVVQRSLKQQKFSIIYTHDWIQEYLQDKTFTIKQFYELINSSAHTLHIQNDYLVIQIQQMVKSQTFPISFEQQHYQLGLMQEEGGEQASSSQDAQFNQQIQVDSFVYSQLFPGNSLINLEKLEDKILTLEQLKGYNNFSENLSDEYQLLGRQYFKKKQFAMAEHYYKKSLDFYQTKNNNHSPAQLQKLSELYHNFSLVYFYKKRGNEALYYCLQSLKLRKDNTDEIKKSESYNLLGIILQNPDNYELSEKYIRRGIHLMEDKEEDTLGRLLNNMGILKMKNQEYLQACDYLQRSARVFQICESKQNANERSKNYMNLATAYSFIPEAQQTLLYIRKSMNICDKIQIYLKAQAIKTLIRLILKLDQEQLPIDRLQLKQVITDFNLQEAECPKALLLFLN